MSLIVINKIINERRPILPSEYANGWNYSPITLHHPIISTFIDYTAIVFHSLANQNTELLFDCIFIDSLMTFVCI
jgi:hypothetical protein